MSVGIRKATIQDMDTVLPLVKDFATSFAISAPAYRESFPRILADPYALALVAEDSGLLIGYCLGFCHDTFYANGKVAWLEEIMVASAYRRQGVGQSMVEVFEEWAKTRGAVLSALATRRASSFYRAIEYKESATYFRKLL